MTNHVCTGLTAFWCPVHGECTCTRTPDGECRFDAGDCPLHAVDSQHGETVELRNCEAEIEALVDEYGIEVSALDRRTLSRFVQWLRERARKGPNPLPSRVE